jgi:hypothetical protein
MLTTIKPIFLQQFAILKCFRRPCSSPKPCPLNSFFRLTGSRRVRHPHPGVERRNPAASNPVSSRRSPHAVPRLSRVSPPLSRRKTGTFCQAAASATTTTTAAATTTATASSATSTTFSSEFERFNSGFQRKKNFAAVTG